MSILVLFLILLTSLSCSKNEAKWKGTIEEIDGVLVIKNPEEPIDKNEKLYTVDTDDEGYYLVKRYKVAWKIGE
jgi:hypothetical protein